MLIPLRWNHHNPDCARTLSSRNREAVRIYTWVTRRAGAVRVSIAGAWVRVRPQPVRGHELRIVRSILVAALSTCKVDPSLVSRCPLTTESIVPRESDLRPGTAGSNVPLMLNPTRDRRFDMRKLFLCFGDADIFEKEGKFS